MVAADIRCEKGNRQANYSVEKSSFARLIPDCARLLSGRDKFTKLTPVQVRFAERKVDALNELTLLLLHRSQ